MIFSLPLARLPICHRPQHSSAPGKALLKDVTSPPPTTSLSPASDEPPASLGRPRSLAYARCALLSLDGGARREKAGRPWEVQPQPAGAGGPSHVSVSAVPTGSASGGGGSRFPRAQNPRVLYSGWYRGTEAKCQARAGMAQLGKGCLAGLRTEPKTSAVRFAHTILPHREGPLSQGGESTSKRPEVCGPPAALQAPPSGL